MWQFSLSVAGDGKVVAGDGNSVCLVVVLVVILVAIVIILYLVWLYGHILYRGFVISGW